MTTEEHDLHRLDDDGNPHLDTPAPEPAPDHGAYDAETSRLVMGAERDISGGEALYTEAKEHASAARKYVRECNDAMRKLIRDREEGRGKRAAPSLLNMLDTAPAKWRSAPVDSLKVNAGILNHLSFEGIANLGQLWDEITSFDPSEGTAWGLGLGDVATIRMALAELADAEGYGQAVAIPEDLWREYPIERWTRYGITAKDVEKLAAGEVKRETGRTSIVTVGNLSDFSKPTASGYTRGYADIKGIGPGGADRISDAETRFWSAWNDGGAEEFARERGLTDGAAGVSRGHGAGVAGAVGDERRPRALGSEGAPHEVAEV